MTDCKHSLTCVLTQIHIIGCLQGIKFISLVVEFVASVVLNLNYTHLYFFFGLQLRIMLSPVIETLVLLDRLLYLQESSVSEIPFCALLLADV